jgi:hypothetical protein
MIAHLASASAEAQAAPAARQKAIDEVLQQDGDPAAVSKLINAATDDELQAFGLRAYQMNLLSLFGETWELDRIEATARAATISKMLGGWEYHHHYLPSLTRQPGSPQIDDIPFGLIANTIEQGRGLIIMTFHFGHMRYLLSDLVHAGFEVCSPFAGDAYGDYATAKQANPSAAFWQTFHFHNVENPAGTIAVARTLANGGLILSAIDGNTGIDGTRGEQQRLEVQLHGLTVRVKVGLFSLAARFGSPIILLATHSVGDRRVCRIGPVIDPQSRLTGTAKDLFVKASAQSAYSFFGELLEDHAGEWCGGDLFHQWRVPGRLAQIDHTTVELSLTHALRAGGRLGINRKRIVPLHSGDDLVWSDARSGSCFGLPRDMAGMVMRLIDPDQGVDQGWLDSQPESERVRNWKLICSLASREAIAEVAA